MTQKATMKEQDNSQKKESAEASMSPPLKEVLRLREYLCAHILGQENLVDKLIMALLADGHLLVEGAPGLAKTKAVRTLADGIEADFHRVQFTPDLLPADLTGTDVYHPQDGSFAFQPGPLFHHIILADEINRSPAKVQSALLEAMAERQITVGKASYQLPDLFLVMATQNPIEQEGTHSLPEAQLDRFLLHVWVDFPSMATEKEILKLNREEARHQIDKSFKDKFDPIKQEVVMQARKEIINVQVSEAVEEYIVQLVNATREIDTQQFPLCEYIQYGASPRGTLALDRCGRTMAWLNGRDYVTPDDIKAVAHETLRHRLILSYKARADRVSADQIIDELLQKLAVA